MPLAAAASQFPFGITDLVLLAVGGALIVAAAAIARRALTAIAARRPLSAVAESDARGPNRLRAVPQPAGSGHAGEQAERGRDREGVVHSGRTRTAG